MRRKIYKLKVNAEHKFFVFALILLLVKVQAQSTYTFNFTGTTQSLSLLAGTYSIEAWGGDGYTQTAGFNGKGGYAAGILTLPSAQTVYINVGGLGSFPSTGVTANMWTFNGGGIGYPASNASYGNGGGASDVRTVGGTWDNAASLAGRVIVAGGGGAGRNSSYIGGNGGGLTGGTGTFFSPDQAGGPTGGSQTAGGSNTGYTSGLTTATLGMAATWNGNALTANFLAGGGGGYYGGASGRVAGGGGSSFIGGVSSGTTIMFGQAGFVPNPVTNGNGMVIIRELCSISVFVSGTTNTLNPSICSGQSLTLTTNAISNYSWSNGATTSSIIVSPTVSTLFALTATSPSNCTASSSASITVSAGLPLVSISNPSNSICLGQSATLTASGALTYSWSNPGVVNAQSFTPVSTAVYTVMGTNGCGTGTAITSITVAPLTVTASSSSTLVCEGTTATLSAQSAVNGYTWQPGALTGSTTIVAPLAATLYTVTASDGICAGTQTVLVTTKTTPTIVASGSAFSICPGAQVILSATGGTSYIWTPGNLSGSSVTVSPATSSLYVVVGTNSVNCSSSASQPVVVGTPPIVNVSANKLLSCSGDLVVLTASGANTYAWIGGPSTAMYSVNPTSTTSYTVVGSQNTNPCTNTKTITINVVVPNVTATSGATTCIGGTVQLVASGATSYIWNGLPGGTITISPAITSVYTLVAQTNSATVVCPTTKTVLVTVNPNPTVTASAARNTICRGQSNTLTATGAASYVWQGTLGTNSTAIVSPTATTIYTLTGTSSDGCTGNAQVTAFVNSCTGIEEQTDKAVIHVYPNPNNGVFFVSAESAITLNVISALGQVIHTIELNAGNGFTSEVSGLAKGVYSLSSAEGAQMKMSKLIVN